jgi:hypothetical protein
MNTAQNYPLSRCVRQAIALANTATRVALLRTANALLGAAICLGNRLPDVRPDTTSRR